MVIYLIVVEMFKNIIISVTPIMMLSMPLHTHSYLTVNQCRDVSEAPGPLLIRSDVHHPFFIQFSLHGCSTFYRASFDGRHHLVHHRFSLRIACVATGDHILVTSNVPTFYISVNLTDTHHAICAQCSHKNEEVWVFFLMQKKQLQSLSYKSLCVSPDSFTVLVVALPGKNTDAKPPRDHPDC